MDSTELKTADIEEVGVISGKIADIYFKSS